jgi:2-polyprenyl-3-methyl-5-hydroxy-6-metoxy-1,4-benzoquinol methylase
LDGILDKGELNVNTVKDILQNISGGRVLDVATGAGGFIQTLVAGLKDYDEIIGIDLSDKGESAFMKAFKDDPRIHFRLMDAEKPEFAEACFDTVCISNSLHHFKNPRLVLDNMNGILRPGGTMIVSEMVQDGQTETQMTHVLLHHWWAAVDRLNGIVHNNTYHRQELIDLVAGLGFEVIRIKDISDCEDDPKDPEIQVELDPVIEKYIQRADGDAELQTKGKELRQRLDDIGFHSAASLIIICKKQVNSF